MSHALKRTSPKGQPFIGVCVKCGKDNLPSSAALQPCPCDDLVSDSAALIGLVKTGADHE